jgi:hypothetical protein
MVQQDAREEEANFHVSPRSSAKFKMYINAYGFMKMLEKGRACVVI